MEVEGRNGINLAEVGKGRFQIVKSNPSEQISSGFACFQGGIKAK